jgi:hypothetical protein
LTVSGFPCSALPPVFVGRLITITGFENSARKAENGFVAKENCFVVRPATKQFDAEFKIFQAVMGRPLDEAARPLTDRPQGRRLTPEAALSTFSTALHPTAP